MALKVFGVACSIARTSSVFVLFPLLETGVSLCSQSQNGYDVSIKCLQDTVP